MLYSLILIQTELSIVWEICGSQVLWNGSLCRFYSLAIILFYFNCFFAFMYVLIYLPHGAMGWSIGLDKQIFSA